MHFVDAQFFAIFAVSPWSHFTYILFAYYMSSGSESRIICRVVAEAYAETYTHNTAHMHISYTGLTWCICFIYIHAPSADVLPIVVFIILGLHMVQLSTGIAWLDIFYALNRRTRYLHHLPHFYVVHMCDAYILFWQTGEQTLALLKFYYNNLNLPLLRYSIYKRRSRTTY